MKLKKRKINFISKKAILGLFVFVNSSCAMVVEACQDHDKALAEKTEILQDGKSWMRPSHAGKNTAAYFCACQMSFPESDKLLRVESDVAKTHELHDHINDNGIMICLPPGFMPAEPSTISTDSMGRIFMIPLSLI